MQFFGALSVSKRYVSALVFMLVLRILSCIASLNVQAAAALHLL